MADDLGEDWWSEKAVNMEGEAANCRIQTKGIEKTNRKRKAKDVESCGKEKENNTLLSPKKKTLKKKKKSASDVIDSSNLWKFFVNSTKGKLSKMELDDLQPNNMDECFLNDTCEPHTSLDQLSPFLIRVIPHWLKTIKSMKDRCKGSPALLIVCSSAKRSVEVNRALTAFKTPVCKTAKLFAKHLKLEEQQDFLSKTTVHVGIGTPNRILKLTSDGFLKLNKLKYVIFDWSYKDAKERKITDIPEVRKDIVDLLQKEIFHRLKDGTLKFGFF